MEYQEAMSKAKKGDLIYCDPPYSPIIEQGSSFSDYHSGGFGEKEHIELAVLAHTMPVSLR